MYMVLGKMIFARDVKKMNDREKMILHLSSNIDNVHPDDFTHLILHIKKHRCRKLDIDEVRELIVEIKEELMLGRSMWEEL